MGGAKHFLAAVGLDRAGMDAAARALGPDAAVTRRGGAVRVRTASAAGSDGEVWFADGPCAGGGGDPWQAACGGGEGRFVAVRAPAREDAVELALDPIGLYPVYAARLGAGSLVANRIGVVRAVLGGRERDLAAAVAMIGLGWPLGDRTLDPRIRVLPGGGPHTIRAGAGLELARGGGLANLAAAGRASPRRAARAALPALAALVAERVRAAPATRCAITGGRDSRAVVALLRAAGLDLELTTRGTAADPDVAIGAAFAARFGYRHRVELQEPGDVVADWDGAAARLLDRCEGMVSLWQAGDVARRSGGAEPAAALLGGIGGEVARGFFGEPGAAEPAAFDPVARALLAKLTRPSAGLLLPAGQEVLAAAVREWIEEGRAAGVGAGDVSDFFYAEQRLRRWGGANAGKLGPERETFAPLATRPFLRAAFSIAPRERARESLHRELLLAVDPAFARFPFERGPLWFPLTTLAGWRARAAAGARVAPARAVPRGEVLFAALAPRMRDEILGHGDAELWNVCDRSAVERALAAPAAGLPPGRMIQQLFNLWTVVRWPDVGRPQLESRRAAR